MHALPCSHCKHGQHLQLEIGPPSTVPKEQHSTVVTSPTTLSSALKDRTRMASAPADGPARVTPGKLEQKSFEMIRCTLNLATTVV
jgi:hypothetical protein